MSEPIESSVQKLRWYDATKYNPGTYSKRDKNRDCLVKLKLVENGMLYAVVPAWMVSNRNHTHWAYLY